MATLVFGIAGAAIGSCVGMPGLGFSVGMAIGTMMFPGNSPTAADKPEDGGLKVSDNVFQSSSYGGVIPPGYGIYRAAGNVIWSSPIVEDSEVLELGNTTSGKGGETTTPITYTRRFLKADIAIAFGEVPTHRRDATLYASTSESEAGGDEVVLTERSAFSGIRRVWLNSNLVYDTRTNQDSLPDTVNLTIYTGLETQLPDSTMEADKGVGNVPAYKGIAYVVIPNLDLTPFGNALPSASAELYERLDRVDSLEEGVEGICMDAGGHLWVASHTMRVVQRIDATTLEVLARVGRDDAPSDQYLGNLPPHPWRCQPSPDGNYVWVLHKTGNQITRISRSDNSYVSFTTHKYGFDIEVDGSGNVWVAYPMANLVRKYSPTDGALLAEVTVEDAPWTLNMNLTSGLLWVSGTRKVTKITTSTSVINAEIETTRFFHGNCAFGTRNTDVWVVVTGEDQAALITRNTNEVRRFRNTGTYPLGIDCHKDDPYGTIYVSTFAGNSVQAYSWETRAQYNAGTISFPGMIVATADGKVWVTNTKIGVIQRVETR